MERHVDKGIYASQLRRWFGAFEPCRFYVTTIERLYLRGLEVGPGCSPATCPAGVPAAGGTAVPSLGPSAAQTPHMLRELRCCKPLQNWFCQRQIVPILLSLQYLFLLGG